MKFFNKSDIIIIAIIIAVAMGSWVAYNFIFSDQSAKAEIYYYSELIDTIDLDDGEDRVFSIPQNHNVVFHLYEDGQICFEESNCPDKVCVNTGKLNQVGQYAACLPNGIVIKIVPGSDRSDEDVDAYVGK